MIDDNKISNYLKYAIGEIVLVVIGILIALQINNWNEKRKSESKAEEYYTQLLDDLNSDINFANNTINDFSQYLNAYEQYIDYYSNNDLDPKKIYEQLAALPKISPPLTFNTSTLESLQNNGDFGLIHIEIRNKLLDLKRLQELIISRYNINQAGKSELLLGLSPLIGATTLPDRLNGHPKMKEYLNMDKNLKELILVYEGIHRWKSVGEEETKERLELMLKEINIIVSLINKELKK